MKLIIMAALALNIAATPTVDPVRLQRALPNYPAMLAGQKQLGDLSTPDRLDVLDLERWLRSPGGIVPSETKQQWKERLGSKSPTRARRSAARPQRLATPIHHDRGQPPFQTIWKAQPITVSFDPKSCHWRVGLRQAKQTFDEPRSMLCCARTAEGEMDKKRPHGQYRTEPSGGSTPMAYVWVAARVTSLKRPTVRRAMCLLSKRFPQKMSMMPRGPERDRRPGMRAMPCPRKSPFEERSLYAQHFTLRDDCHSSNGRTRHRPVSSAAL